MKRTQIALQHIRNAVLGLSLAAVLGTGLFLATPASHSQRAASLNAAPHVQFADGQETHGKGHRCLS